MSTIYVRPDVRAFLDALATTPLANLKGLGVSGARDLMEQVRASRPTPAHNLSVVRDLACDGPRGPIELRFMTRGSNAPMDRSWCITTAAALSWAT